MIKFVSLGIAVFSMEACATSPPQSPMQKAVNRSVGFSYAAENCGGLVGGFSDIREMQSLAQQNRDQENEMGATEVDFATAQQYVINQFTTGSILVGEVSTCNALMNSLARAA